MKVLLTGGNGFVGRHVLDALRQREIAVVLCGRNTPMSFPYGAEFLPCDLLDAEAVTSLCQKAKGTHLLHLAWGMSPTGGYWTSEDNLRWLSASQHLIRAFITAGGHRVVGVGTGVEYSPVRGPRDEYRTPTIPDTVYGKAKLACGAALQALAASLSFSGVWARLFYLFGPGEKPERLMPAACRALRANSPFCCKNGNAFLDYMDVRDAAQALASLLLSDIQGVVNIASGKGRYVKDILRALAVAVDMPAAFAFETPQRNNGLSIVARTKRLRAELGFTSRYSLEQSLLDCFRHSSFNEGHI